jgi:hypothetical protein
VCWRHLVFITYSRSPALACVVFLLWNMRGRGSWIDTVLNTTNMNR